MLKRYNYPRNGFTIVELLVVIVVIGVLAAITIVSYSSISQKAIAASVQTDLTNMSKRLKLYYVEYGKYPQTIDGSNCPQSPSDQKYCLKNSSGSVLSYCSSTPYNSFILVEQGPGSISYQITDSTPPLQITGGGGTVPVFCSGGTISQNGSTRNHTFDTSCTSASPCNIVANSAGTITITAKGGGGAGGRDDEELGLSGSNGDRVVYSTAVNKNDSLSIIVGLGSISINAPTGAAGYSNGSSGGVSPGTTCSGGFGDDGLAWPGAGGAGSSGVRLAGVRIVEAKGGAGGKSGGFWSYGCNEFTAGGAGGAGGGANYPSVTTVAGGGTGGAHNLNGSDGSVQISYSY